MGIGFIVWAVSVLLGPALLVSLSRVRKLWHWRKILGEAAIGLFLTGLVFVAFTGLPYAAIVCLVVVQIWFIVVAARLPFGRLEPVFLQTSTVLNVIIGVALASFVCLAVAFLHIFNPQTVFLAMAGVSVFVAILFLYQIIWTFRHFRLPKPRLSLTQLPTVSVCIPARNEDHELTECIAAVLRSDYPKLEVLVLDDCSQDKTADVIKSFAHDGVRFVQGETPASGWLGKNQAMQTLAEHASGEWLLFLSADTRVGRSSVTQLVHYALAAKRQMVSVLPQNHRGVGADAFLGTLQYFWRIALPITKRRVPVSSKCWFIRTDRLKALGGFGAVKHKVVPEDFFARQLFTHNDYRFFVGDARFDMTTAKSRASQLRTSIRLLYPTYKRQPFFVLLAVAAIIGLLLMPFFMLFVALATQQAPLFLANVIAVGLLFLSYLLVLFRTHPASWAVGFLFLPVVLVQEVILLCISMLAYEFSEVSWKGRNVCYPVISAGQTSRPLPTELKH